MALNVSLLSFLFKEELVYFTQDIWSFAFLISPQTSKSVMLTWTLLRTLEVTLLILSQES